MLQTVVTLVAICSVVQSSGVHHVAPVANAPVVTATSSQYFERTFNRLIASPVLVEPSPQQLVPVQSIQPVPVQPAQPVTHFHPVPSFQSVQAIQSVQPLQPLQPAQPVQPVRPLQPLQPVQPQPLQPVEPNIAIAVATANAAAPVATILLPPYPFGFPPHFGFIPQEQPSNDESTKEQTTSQAPTTQADQKTTKEPETTTQEPQSSREPSGSDNNPVQAFPSNQDVNFRQYLTPSPQSPNQDVNFKQQPSNQNVNFRQQPSNQNVNFRQQPSNQNVNFRQQPSNQNVNFRQYLAPQHSNQGVNFMHQPPNPNFNFGPNLAPRPSNQDLNFRQYLGPNLQPQWPQNLPMASPVPHYHHHYAHKHLHANPLKLKTVVEVQRVPLAYIAPPPLPHFENNHQAIKVVKHIHSFVPSRAKLIIRPVSSLRTRSIPTGSGYKSPLPSKNVAPRTPIARSFNPKAKDIEVTTFRPFLIPNTKPPRL